MIPEFPNFKKLELSDKAEIEGFTTKYLPYSDFNFISMWSWDIKGEMMISVLNGNLAVRFTDYLDGEPFYSFLGGNEINDTATKLINFSVKENGSAVLKLIPEETATTLDQTQFETKDDINHYDYVLSINKLLPHDGTERKLSSRRKLINKFKEKNKVEIMYVDSHDKDFQKSLFNVFNEWEAQLKIKELDIQHLRLALTKLFSIQELKPTVSFGVYVNDILAGYSINEILHDGYALGHFQQANLRVSNVIYAILMQEVAPCLDDLACKYINIEQDLGIPGLRSWKQSYNPAFFLKKYVVSRRK